MVYSWVGLDGLVYRLGRTGWLGVLQGRTGWLGVSLGRTGWLGVRMSRTR